MAARLGRLEGHIAFVAHLKRVLNQPQTLVARCCFSSHAKLYEHRTYFQRGLQQPLPQSGETAYRENEGGKQIGASGWKIIGTQVLVGSAFFFGYLFGSLDSQTERLQAKKSRRTSAASAENAAAQFENEQSESDDEDQDDEVVEDPHLRILQLRNESLQAQLINLENITVADKMLRERDSLLDGANAAQLEAHNAFFEILTTRKDDRVILDEALLESRPIILSDQTRVPASKAALVRMLDAKGKNRLIVFGIDLDWHKDFKRVSNVFPSDQYGLDAWITELTNELNAAGEISDHGLRVYLYCNRAIVHINHETGYQFLTRYKPSDFPEGFPLRQMRNVQRVQDSNGSLENRAKVGSKLLARSGKDKEAP